MTPVLVSIEIPDGGNPNVRAYEVIGLKPVCGTPAGAEIATFSIASIASY